MSHAPPSMSAPAELIFTSLALRFFYLRSIEHAIYELEQQLELPIELRAGHVD